MEFIHPWFSLAAAQTSGEVPFIRKLVAASDQKVLQLANVSVEVSSVMLHQKPYVVFEMNGHRERCELADLLVVVTYQKGAQIVERKSILYQAKVQYAKKKFQRGSWEVQANQHYCLAKFPEMWPSHSRDAPKPVNTWKVSPRTLDFGCYLLLTRENARRWRHDQESLVYVLAPSATALSSKAGFKWSDLGYAYGGLNRFVKHVLFEAGEPHNVEVDKFVNAVIVASGAHSLQPPTICHITKNYDGAGNPVYDEATVEDGGFGIIRITVNATGIGG